MTSIHTNAGAISALQTLRSTGSAMERTQGQVSSGLRIQSASDNAAYWSIATTMKSENKALSAVSDSIALGQAILDTTYSGMNRILEYMDEAKKLIVMASNEGEAATNGTWYDYERDPVYDATTLGKIDRQLREVFDSILSVVDSASFNGVNLLKIEKGGPSLSSSIDFVTGLSGAEVQTTTLNLKDTVMVNFNRSGDYYDYEPGASEQGFIDGKTDIVTYELTATYFNTTHNEVRRNGDFYIVRNGLWNYNNTPGYDSTDLMDYFNNFIDGIDNKIEAITAGMATVGSLQKSMEMSADFTKTRMDTIDKGVGRLVDADMNEASTRLKALQTQEQLGIQALQIANSNSENILSLFR